MADESELELTTTAPRTTRRPEYARARVLRAVASPDPEILGAALPVDGDPYIIGRKAPPPGRLLDVVASREHARIVPIRGGVLLEDLGGSNGTLHNGRRITSPTALLPNDVVLIGETAFVLDEEPARDLLPAAPGAGGMLVPEFVGWSFFAERVRRSIETVAPTAGAILVLGATGTGKEVVARAAHRLSGRRGALVSVNAAAIPADLAEAELFGHEKGAFTGAIGDRRGVFEQAHGGTLFLDELGDLPLPLQAKLLRVLEEQSVTPLGGTARPIDVRVVAATQVDIDVSDFRSDLRARLADWTLRLLPLRERRADILPLFRHSFGADGPELSAEVAEALLLYSWPANVRELAKMAARLRTLSKGSAVLLLEHLPEELATRNEEEKPASERSDPEPPPVKEELHRMLAESRGNLMQLAERNGWHRTQLYRWMKKYGLEIDDYR